MTHFTPEQILRQIKWPKPPTEELVKMTFQGIVDNIDKINASINKALDQNLTELEIPEI
jgi:hypothetical protein